MEDSLLSLYCQRWPQGGRCKGNLKPCVRPLYSENGLEVGLSVYPQGLPPRMPRMRRAASLAASRTCRSVRLALRLARVLSVLLALSRFPERPDVESSRVVEEPRLLRADLPLLPEVPEVSSPVPVESFEVASVLLLSCVLAVVLPLLLLSALFLEHPAAAIATTTARAMIWNLLFIVYHSPYRGASVLD